MVRTILADNEVWICKLIESMVDWESLGFSIVGTAYNGLELYNMAVEKRPDLIITDIQMSGMTGLEALAKLKSENIFVNAIIISGYDDFSYARTAIDLNVYTYLLKPLDETTLTKTLTEFKEKLSNTASNSTAINELKEQLNTMSQQYFYTYLKNLLYGERSTLSLSQINEKFNTRLQPGVFRVLLLALDPKIPGQTVDEKSRMYVTEIIMETLRPIVYEQDYIKSDPFWILALNYAPENNALITEALNGLISTNSNTLPSLIVGSHITIGVGAAIDNLTDIRQSYTAALDAVHARTITGTGRAIDLSDQIITINGSLSSSTKNMLSSFVNSYSSKETPETLADMIFDNYKHGMPPYALYDIVRSALSLAISSLPKDVHEKFPEENDGKNIKSLLEQLDFVSTGANLKKTAVRLLEQIRNLNHNLKSESSAIYKLKSYIDEHLDQDISLNDLADLVNYNPNYLSDYFKKETGENVNKYIMHLRIEKAKILLANPRIKCKEVAVQVGYRDLNYFTRIFKTAVGITPKEYQKIFART